ncbi:carbohydrate-binding domain-containing protein [Thalassiella azotivora]
MSATHGPRGAARRTRGRHLPGVVAAVAATFALTGATLPAAAGVDRPRAVADETVLPHEWSADPGTGSVYTGRSGWTGTGFGLWRTGSATAPVDLPRAATRMVLEASADLCPQYVGARATVLVDGERVLVDQLVDVDSGRYVATGDWAPGPHHVEVRFTDDYRTAGCDRNLKLSRLWFDGGDPAMTRVAVDASSLNIMPPSIGRHYTKGPQGSPTVVLWSNGGAGTSVTTQAITRGSVSVLASAHDCEGPARMLVWVSDRYVGQTEPGPDQHGTLRWHSWALPFDLPAGRHGLKVEFVNQHRGETCERGLKVGMIALDGGRA